MLQLFRFQSAKQLTNRLPLRNINKELDLSNKWRSFRKKTPWAPEEPASNNNVSIRVPIGQPKIGGPFVFTVLVGFEWEYLLQLWGWVSPRSLLTGFAIVQFSGSCIVTAGVLQYESLKDRAMNFKRNAFGYLQNKIQPRQGEMRSKLNQWWSGLYEGQKVFAGILFLNSLVFLAWRIPQLAPVMKTYFTASPFSCKLSWKWSKNSNNWLSILIVFSCCLLADGAVHLFTPFCTSFRNEHVRSLRIFNRYYYLYRNISR